LCANPASCYNPPGCTGLSEYYAIDITDAQNPVLLWEFSHPFLGYSYSGPAVIRKWTNPATLLGDQYYVMFLSGPTNGTDGSSIQDVQAFVLTLNPANLGISSVYYKDLGATTKNGFGGRLFTPGLDVNADGYTDFVFFGYANSANGTSTDWTGGLAKINTNNTNPNLATNPANWTYDITTYANIATLPITAKVATMQCFNNTWYLYAGTGRYFSSQDSYGYTPASSSTPAPNYLMGIPFTCDQFNNNCTSISSLSSQNAIATACASSNGQTIATTLGQGWIDTLDAAAADGSYLAERLVTDPTINPGTVQNPANQVFFTTSEPTSISCLYGGHSRVWGLNCATGGPITGSCGTDTITSSGINGFLYLQTSTGAIYQITDAGSFGSAGGRATQWFTGMPPESSPSFVQPTISIPQQGRIIQWIEK
jgi:type IV pilus assembly protein PilY1